MLLGSSLLPQGATRSRYAWTAATWDRDASGRAYNTPTLGSELATDGGFETWATATDLTNWTESVGGTSTVNRESSVVQAGSFAARLDVDAGNGLAMIYQSMSPSAGFLRHSVMAKTSAAVGSFVFVDNAGAALSADNTLTTSYTEYPFAELVAGGAINRGVKRQSANSKSLYFDSYSAKNITITSAAATVLADASNLTAAARVLALTTGMPAGVVACWDGVNNGIFAYHDGVGVTLLKVVGGTWSTVIARVAVALVADALLEIRRPSGNTFQLWYDGTQRGTDQTISDAGIISNTRYGLFSTYVSNLFSQFLLGGALVPFGF